MNSSGCNPYGGQSRPPLHVSVLRFLFAIDTCIVSCYKVHNRLSDAFTQWVAPDRVSLGDEISVLVRSGSENQCGEVVAVRDVVVQKGSPADQRAIQRPENAGAIRNVDIFGSVGIARLRCQSCRADKLPFVLSSLRKAVDVSIVIPAKLMQKIAKACGKAARTTHKNLSEFRRLTVV